MARSASGAVRAYFMVTLSEPLATPVTFHYATSDGTALAGRDYQSLSGIAFIGPGSIRQKLAVTVYGVNSNHPETATSKVAFTMTISHAVGATIDRSHAQGTILELPSVSVSDVKVVQALKKPPVGESPIAAYFSISISPRLDRPVTVNYRTVDGTAVHGVDYRATSGVVTIPANSVVVRVPVKIKTADQSKYVYSAAHTVFYLDISTSISGVYVTRWQGKATITEHQPATAFASSAASLSIEGPSVARSASGAVRAYFMVTLSEPLATPVTFHYATSDGTALAGRDYQSLSGIAFIGPGSIRQKLAVTVYGVNSNHPETATSKVAFTMTISHAVGATIDRSHAQGTILELPSVSVSDVKVVQALKKPPVGESPIAAYFSISISPRLDRPVTVNYRTVDGTAVHGVDYRATSGVVTIPANSVVVRVPVKIKTADQSKYVYSAAHTVFYLDISTSISGVYVTRWQGKATITEHQPVARMLVDVASTGPVARSSPAFLAPGLPYTQLGPASRVVRGHTFSTQLSVELPEAGETLRVQIPGGQGSGNSTTGLDPVAAIAEAALA